MSEKDLLSIAAATLLKIWTDLDRMGSWRLDSAKNLIGRTYNRMIEEIEFYEEQYEGEKHERNGRETV